MNIRDIKVIDLCPGDCIIRNTCAYEVIKISKFRNCCNIICKSMKSGIKFMFQLYNYENLEKTEVIKEYFSVINTDISKKPNKDGSYDVSFNVFDENCNNRTTFILELDDYELDIINKKQKENQMYKMNIVSFLIKENNEYRVFVKLNI